MITMETHFVEVSIKDIMDYFAKDFCGPQNGEISIKMVSYHIDTQKQTVIFKLNKEKM